MKVWFVRTILLSLFAAAGLPLGSASAQNPQNKTAAALPAQPQTAQAPARKEALGPVAESIRPYRPAGKDPFKKNIVRVGVKGRGGGSKALGFPSLEVRRAEFQQRAARARAADQAEPDPFTQYLVSELDVIGVFSDDKGPGAFVRAHPTGTTFFVRRGAKCWNGEILRIENDPSDLSGARVMFKEQSKLELPDGKTSDQDRVVAKSAASQGRM